MPQLNNSILLHLEVFAADSNIRRNVLSVATNTKGDETLGNLAELTRIFPATVTPAAAPYVITPEASNKLTVLRAVGGSLNIKLTKGLEVINFIVTDNIFVFPANCTSIEITNTSTSIVKLHLIQL